MEKENSHSYLFFLGELTDRHNFFLLKNSPNDMLLFFSSKQMNPKEK